MQEIHRFLHAVRGLLRGRNAVAMATVPPSLVRSTDEEGIKRLSWAVDASLELKGFAGMSLRFSLTLWTIYCDLEPKLTT